MLVRTSLFVETTLANHILTPTHIVLGGGALRQTIQVLRTVGSTRPLLVIDPNLLRLGLAAPLLAALEHASIPFAVFDGVVEDPTDECVAAAAATILAGSHDGVLGFGGGSAIDTAKAAALVASTGEKVTAFRLPRIVDLPIMPVIAIPTTAGTGSEVTRACVVTDAQSHEKMLILGSACLPRAAIVDYELTLSCPFRVTADTGLDALTHALEALVNRNRNAHADALAGSALRLIGANLETVCRDPANRPAREAMMLGAMHAGLAVSNTSTALVHGMSRPLGAFFKVPHGLSNAMLLPAVTEFSADAAPDAYAAAAVHLGWAASGDPTAIAVGKLIDGFWRLNAALQVPTPEQYGIDKDRYHAMRPTMAKQALASGTPGNNPRVPDAEQIMALYDRAWGSA